MPFDEESAETFVDIARMKGNSSFVDRGLFFKFDILSHVKDNLTQLGVTVSDDDIKIDKNGIISYSGTMFSDKNNLKTRPVDGYIGRVFVPDKDGVTTVTMHGIDEKNDSNSYSFIAGYRGFIDYSKEGGFGEKVCLSSYEQIINKALSFDIKSKMLGRLEDTGYDVSTLNYVYRHLYTTRFLSLGDGEKFSDRIKVVNFKEPENGVDFKKLALKTNTAEALKNLMHGRVAFSSDFSRSPVLL